nr:zinc-finger homeodomain protein 6-like [Quercus suber]POE68184.1 zinc-finger homeodomain protein 6 [Quercus suber]
MELRGQDKEIRMPLPSTLGYNPTHKDSSTKLSSPTVASTVGERRRDQTAHGNTIFNPAQTLDHQHHHHPLPQQPNPNSHNNTHKPGRDPDANPDQIPAPIATPSGATTTAITSASKKSPTPQRQPQPQQNSSTIRAAPPKVIRYRECLKNHAASMGGHVVDGCGEFMPNGDEGTLEALKCAACECHRNFHRKETEGESQYVSNSYYNYNPNTNNDRREIVLPQHHRPPPLTPLPHHLHHHHHHRPHPVPIAPMMMAFGTGGGVPAESSSEDLGMFRSDHHVGVKGFSQARQSKKRFRTKFSQEQKDKMMEFAEKLGWKIQKHDEQDVQNFCLEVGIKRQVFKVWMHNNKQAMKKKQM